MNATCRTVPPAVGEGVALARADLLEGNLIAATHDLARFDEMDVPARGPNPLREHAHVQWLGKVTKKVRWCCFSSSD